MSGISKMLLLTALPGICGFDRPSICSILLNKYWMVKLLLVKLFICFTLELFYSSLGCRD